LKKRVDLNVVFRAGRRMSAGMLVKLVAVGSPPTQSMRLPSLSLLFDQDEPIVGKNDALHLLPQLRHRRPMPLGDNGRFYCPDVLDAIHQRSAKGIVCSLADGYRKSNERVGVEIFESATDVFTGFVSLNLVCALRKQDFG
jgi:hypothetical protein